jgi:hypothetical protein
MGYFIGPAWIRRHLDMRHCWCACFCLAAWACFLVCAMASYPGTAAAETQDSQPVGQTLQEVTVTATRAQNHRALAHAVAGFVTSHATPGARINQIGRWDENVCPLVVGLQPPGRDFVTREILDVARGVGAPTGAVRKKCAVTVDIVFTRGPQALLDHIAKAYRPLLGFYPASLVNQMTTFSRPIQAWYETGTRSMDTQMPIPNMGPGSVAQNFGAGPGADVPLLSGTQVDSEVTAMGMQPSGAAGSYLGKGLRSEFLHIMIIADSDRLARYPLKSVADYLALLSLTRVAQLDQCAPLPSITDLLVSGCATPVAGSLTAADRGEVASATRMVDQMSPSAGGAELSIRCLSGIRSWRVCHRRMAWPR